MIIGRNVVSYDWVSKRIVELLDSDPSRARGICRRALASRDERLALAAGRTLDRLIDDDPAAAAPLIRQLLDRVSTEISRDEIADLNEMLHPRIESLMAADDLELRDLYRRVMGHGARYISPYT